MSSNITKSDIRKYYEENHLSFEDGWVEEQDHKGIHVGYYDDNQMDHDEAIENMTRFGADRIDIQSDDRVLCAGCGIGGPAVWIAANRGANVVGINISESQLEQARTLAKNEGVTDRTQFQYDDFTEMSTLEEDAFDVVWGLEAICYAKSKRAFLEEAHRVLRPGGRLIVIDGFMNIRSPSPSGKRKMKKWLDAWAIPHLTHVDDFRGYLDEIGYRELEEEEITSRVIKSLKLMYLYSLYGYPVSKALQMLGRQTESQVQNTVGCHYVYRSITDGLWTYNVFTAEK
ncbi:UbiE/COQ5 family methyltransferase [Natrinema mahii]|nr:UbiE/COQ5 family methyltransferase [Natrinema mahii]